MNERAYDAMNFEETCSNDTDDFEETGNTPDSEAAGYMESEPHGRDDEVRTENEREPTVEKENSYPPVKENNGQDDPPEITYYQREGQKGGMLRSEAAGEPPERADGTELPVHLRTPLRLCGRQLHRGEGRKPDGG